MSAPAVYIDVLIGDEIKPAALLFRKIGSEASDE